MDAMTVRRRARYLLAALVGGALLPAIVLLGLNWAQARRPAVSGFLAPSQLDLTGFARAESVLALRFPDDHGPHPEYQTEWWYYTGNLDAEDGRHYGYQLTFFRRALVPPDRRPYRASLWGTSQVYMAHFALTDVAGETHYQYERFSRGAAGLAGATSSPYQVWVEDWLAERSNGNEVRLYAGQDRISIDLRLTETKAPVLQGDGGLSQKGPEPGNASYYYSLTRLQSAGTMQVEGETFQVAGLSWMDHEYSTSALAADQVGWDWFSLQMDDGSELMVFQLRKVDGSVDAYSSGVLVEADGTTHHLGRDDFRIVSEATWRSPQSGGVYPALWQVQVPSRALTLQIEPYLADQEWNVSYVYWEGAVRCTGERRGMQIAGHGYVELTGYVGSMQGQL